MKVLNNYVHFILHGQHLSTRWPMQYGQLPVSASHTGVWWNSIVKHVYTHCNTHKNSLTDAWPTLLCISLMYSSDTAGLTPLYYFVVQTLKKTMRSTHMCHTIYCLHLKCKLYCSLLFVSVCICVYLVARGKLMYNRPLAYTYQDRNSTLA